MMRSLGTVGVLFTLIGMTVAGPSWAAGLEAWAWAITPEDSACHTDLELVARSGAVAPISLISDGDHVALRFSKEGVPSQAFLPIRIDGKPFSNLVQRTGEEGVALMNLSDETLSALRRGKTLQVAWLSEEAVSASLAGAGQGVGDLKVCGAQVAGQHRLREAQMDAQRAHAQAEARAKAVADEQLATARAQTAAAQAERQRAVAEAQRVSAEAEEIAARAEQTRQRTLVDQDRLRAIAAQQRDYGHEGYDDPPAPRQQPVPYGYYRPYYSPR